MEALTGVSAALLTIYDMCKALDKNMVMGNIHLEEKTGGKSGPFRFAGEAAGSGQKSLAGQKAPAGQEGSAGEIEDKKERIPLRVAVIVSSDLGYAGKTAGSERTGHPGMGGGGERPGGFPGDTSG